MTATFNQLEDVMTLAPVIPVLTVENPEHAVPMARALVAGGLKVLEVTLRTHAALEVIQRIATEVPEAHVGAGTILTPAHVDQVARAGGRFCVSPGVTPAVIKAARDAEMKLLPGAVTPTEVMNLLDQDMHYLKFFPAQAAGGVPMLKSFSAPLSQARFCPTGGIRLETAPEFLALPNVLCVGGTWVCPKALLDREDWSAIENLAAEAAGIGS